MFFLAAVNREQCTFALFFKIALKTSVCPDFLTFPPEIYVLYCKLNQIAARYVLSLITIRNRLSLAWFLAGLDRFRWLVWFGFGLFGLVWFGRRPCCQSERCWTRRTNWPDEQTRFRPVPPH
jgi:hypothetical protein